MLSYLRLQPDQARGRKYPELPHPYRNDFQRDRDRIIHSRPFRRLEGKTQVFAPTLSDHFRNRLTHTLEVAQIARTVASVLELNEELTEALALAHDVGHPPFAHAGERELDQQMQRFGVRFEHNLQSLRLFDKLEQRYARFDGLNLTFEVREGIVKHSREVTAADEPWLQEFLPELRPPLEAQLLDAADEIAYNSADLDDAHAAGLLTIDEISAQIPFFAARAEEVEGQFPGAPERLRFYEILRAVINELVGGLIQGTIDRAQAAEVRSVDDVRHAAKRLAGFTAAAAQLDRELKELLMRRVYQSPELVAERQVASARIAALFQYLLAHPEHISDGYRERLDHSKLERVICDYIAGMTDAFFNKTYAALVG